MARSKQKAMNEMPSAWSPGTINYTSHWKSSLLSIFLLFILQSPSSLCIYFLSIPLFLTPNSCLSVLLESEKSPFTTTLKCYSFSVSQITGQQLKQRNFPRCPATRWLLMPPQDFSLAAASNINSITGHRENKAGEYKTLNYIKTTV